MISILCSRMVVCHTLLACHCLVWAVVPLGRGDSLLVVSRGFSWSQAAIQARMPSASLPKYGSTPPSPSWTCNQIRAA